MAEDLNEFEIEILREKFEEWAKIEKLPLDRYSEPDFWPCLGIYRSVETNAAWQGFKKGSTIIIRMRRGKQMTYQR